MPDLSPLTRLADGTYITEDGEALPFPAGEAPLAWAARQRARADQQVRAWEAERARWDAFLVAEQEEQDASYDGVTIQLRQSTTRRLDSDAFADAVAELPLEYDDLIAIVRAARAFRDEDIPESVQDAYRRALHTSPTRMWVESSAEPAEPESEELQ